jgi:uncharacterized protein DUF992
MTDIFDRLAPSQRLCGALAYSQSARKQATSARRGFSRELGVSGMFKKVGLALGAIGLAAAVSAQGTPALAQAGVRVGTLSCNVAAGWGFIFGSSKALRCVFSGAPGHYDHYAGTINKFGVDIGYTQGGVLVWAVFAPTAHIGPGALAGSYVGATGSATVGVGAGANVLIGGSNRTISLQPVSIEGNTGLNVAAGIGAINLRFAR